MDPMFKLLVVSCLVAIAMSAPKEKGKANGRIRKTQGHANLKDIKMKKDTDGRAQFPEKIDVEITVDDTKLESNEAVHDLHMQENFKTQSLTGKEQTITKKNCAMYTKGNDVFQVCDPVDDGDETTRLVTARVHVNSTGEVCTVYPGSVTLCQKADEDVQPFTEVLERNTTSERSKRQSDTIPSIDDYNATYITELLVFVDSAWMDVFREISDTEDEALDAAVSYLYLLLVEINHMYRSIGDVSRADSTMPDFEVLVYMQIMYYPSFGYELPFVKVRSNGGLFTTGCNGWYDCTGTLPTFGAWLEGFVDTTTPSFDHATLLSGRNIYSGSSSGLLGVTYLGSVCNTEYFYQVSVVESLGPYDEAATFAHELGHALGAPHDGDSEYGTGECVADTHLMAAYYIQADTTTKDTYTQFSTCSVETIYNHLLSMRSAGRDCLTSTVSSADWIEQFCSGSGRGEEFTLDFHCYIATMIPTSTACFESSDPEIIDGKVNETACWKENVVGCTDGSGNCNKRLPQVSSGVPCYTSASTSGDSKICHNRKCLSDTDVCQTSSTTSTTSSTTSTTSTTTSTTPSTTSTTASTTSTTPSTTSTTSSTTSTTPSTTSTTASTTSTTPSTTSTTSSTTSTTPSTTSTTASTTSTTPSTTSTTPSTTSTPGCSCSNGWCCFLRYAFSGICCTGCTLQGGTCSFA